MTNHQNELVACPCCGNHTLSEAGEYEVCPLCLWEDDPGQLSEPNYSGAANQFSLNQARKKWLKNASRS